MRIERATRLRTTAISQLSSLASRAVFYGMSFKEFNDEYEKIFDRLRKAKCPATVDSYVSGYLAHIWETWYATELAYCHKAPDGTLYSAVRSAVQTGLAHDVDAIYKANRGQEIPTWESGHYWLGASARARKPKVY